MTIKESIEQLESLAEAWKLDEADLNQTDINAIKCLLNNRQELIEYLKEKIKECKTSHKLYYSHEMIRFAEDESLKKRLYEEILSKIEQEVKK